MNIQHGILAPVPAAGRFVSFALSGTPLEAGAALQALCAQFDSTRLVLGLGESLALSLGRSIPGLRAFPRYQLAGLEIPATPAALWCWLRGDDRGEILHAARRLEQILAPAFVLTHSVDAFKHGSGRDLSGYEDGTENPQDEAALAAVTSLDSGQGLAGGSYVAVQQWLHDFSRLEAMSSEEQDHCIGRRKSDNEELDDAPESAHVKRTAQESFSPEAFVLRRSMPWAESGQAGLVFVAFGKSLDAFEAQLRRMVGAEDGIVDALFRFTQPLTGAYFWCPPVREGRFDLTALGV